MDGARPLDPSDQDPFLVRGHPEAFPELRIFQFLPRETQVREARVLAGLFVVSDEVLDDGHRHDVPHVLRFFAFEALERNPNAIPDLVEGGTTAVTAVNGRIHLDGRDGRGEVEGEEG